MRGFQFLCVIAAVSGVLASFGCAANPRPSDRPAIAVRRSTTAVVLHGKPLELHLSAPERSGHHVLVLYASGDGGWFGAAVNMFEVIGNAGYYAAGFSAKSFLKLERPHGGPLTPAQLADEYEHILGRAREALNLDPDVAVILTGWSRGASFAVLAAAEGTTRPELRGVIAIGLTAGEDLQPGDDDDDDGADDPASLDRQDGADGKVGPDANAGADAGRHWPFLPYARIARLGALPCAVIQSSHDNYLPAAHARDLFGPDTVRPPRRLYTIDARNHRFSGGTQAFNRAFVDAMEWVSAAE